MNKVIFTLSVLLSAGFGYFVGKNSEKYAISSTKQDTLVQTASDRLSKVEMPSAGSENNFHGGAQNISSSATVSSIQRSVPDTNQLVQQQIDAVKAEYEFKQRSEEFTQWLTKNQQENTWFDLGVEMRGRFDSEETDHNWALAEESHIQSLFFQKPALAGVALKSTRCKSTQCQITISVMNNDHANETAMAISQVLSSEGAAQIIIDNQVQQGEAIFYVARNEKGFEFN